MGPVEVLVNNAGITRDGLLVRMKPDDWDAVIAANLSSVFYCTKEAVRDMAQARWGRITNELLTRVKKESPDVAVIVLTSFDDDSTMLNALAQHASGFLLKDASPDEVVRAVIAAHSGGTTISPVSASRLISQHLRPPRSGAGPDLTQ